ncbi:hypothetical protein B2G71_08295 [Novosphingobium sp. PC22D]|uniref:DUF1178 family protein n=1 Tax=Novosphingobium sp. PC22D TaxID=1962403 RepID=UPI000BF170A5|nr:DUF1178 family protein [Novosphingobium sp. PC22D]PEQ13416.1 hypothetical protein B2G71_08295 [Novosphingobium sp. PC22D]
MIVFDLECRAGGHRFEGWFGSTQDYERQRGRGLLSCPECGSADVGKAVTAPRLGRKGNQLAGAAPEAPASRDEAPGRSQGESVSHPVASRPLPPEALEMMHKLAKLQAETLKSSRYVGDKFAEDVREMHYGERDHEVIHGEATAEEAAELIEEGIAVAPLPFPVIPPEKAN